jgi:hypothetical protein
VMKARTTRTRVVPTVVHTTATPGTACSNESSGWGAREEEAMIAPAIIINTLTTISLHPTPAVLEPT